MKHVEKAKDKINDVDTTIADYIGVEYQVRQNTKNKEDKFSDLW